MRRLILLLALLAGAAGCSELTGPHYHCAPVTTTRTDSIAWITAAGDTISTPIAIAITRRVCR